MDIDLLRPKTVEVPSPASSMPCLTIDRGIPVPPRAGDGGPRQSAHSKIYRALEIGVQGYTLVVEQRRGRQGKREEGCRAKRQDIAHLRNGPARG